MISPLAYEVGLATSTDQQLMVTMGISHSFALWFPRRVQPTGNLGEFLVKAPFHLIMGPLASTCARPLEGLGESMATHRPSLDDLQRGSTMLAKLITDAGQLLAPVTVQHFRDLCDSFLLPLMSNLTISSLDLVRVPLILGASDSTITRNVVTIKHQLTQPNSILAL